MTRAGTAAALACALWTSAVAAQPVRVLVRARLGRFGALVVTVCPGDPPPAAWRQRAREEFNDPTFTLYEPSAETAAIRPELRVVLRAAQCAEGVEAYELFMTDRRGEAAQTTMLRMGGVPREDRPQVAALRVAEVFRTHRAELVGPDPPPLRVEIPRSRREVESTSQAWDLEVGIAARALPSSRRWLLGPQVAFGRRPTPASRQRLRFELGVSVLAMAGTQASSLFYREWLACGWTIAVLRTRRLELAVGGRGELALNWLYPTVAVGVTAEAQVALSGDVWLWTRVDVGGHVIGAQLRDNPPSDFFSVGGLSNLAEGFTAALTAGVRFGL